MNQNQTTTIGAILEMQPGDQQNKVWLNEGFDALVSNVTSRPTAKGAPMITCWLSDPDNDQIGIGAKLFGRRAFNFDGQVCAFSGQGMSLGEYNGRSELTIGEKTLVQAIGQQGPPQRQAGPPARQNPPPRTNPPTPQNRAPAGNGAAPARNGNDYAEGQRLSREGQRIGMAMGKAIDIVESWTGESIVEPGTPEWSTAVWKIASDIMRVAQFMEAGNLAKSPTARAAGDNNTGVDLSPEEQAAADAEAQAEADRQEAASRQAALDRGVSTNRVRQTQAARPQPGPGGSVALDDDSDSIPF
jgi:hypothetical protein